jgi:hypothetical protein
MFERRIDHLETALLHLTRAVTSLLGAVQSLKDEAKVESPQLRLIETSETQIRQAHQHLVQAVELMSEPAENG